MQHKKICFQTNQGIVLCRPMRWLSQFNGIVHAHAHCSICREKCCFQSLLWQLEVLITTDLVNVYQIRRQFLGYIGSMHCVVTSSYIHSSNVIAVYKQLIKTIHLFENGFGRRVNNIFLCIFLLLLSCPTPNQIEMLGISTIYWPFNDMSPCGATE